MAALRVAVFQLSAKNLKGGVQTPPGPARVNIWGLKIRLESYNSREVIIELSNMHSGFWKSLKKWIDDSFKKIKFLSNFRGQIHIVCKI